MNLGACRCRGSALGGHLVTGHVDGVATVRTCAEEAGSLHAEVEAPGEFARFIAEKGSVTLDGVSLTVGRVAGARVRDRRHTPHAKATTLGGIAPGQALNLEVDLLARYSRPAARGAGSPMNTIEELLAELAAGRMVVVMDDEERENEGDLLMAASCARPEDINFMARHGRGLICLTLTEERCRKLRLPLMVRESEDRHGTNFTVSIEAAQGVTTGISAQDRAHTVQTAVAAGRASGGPAPARPRFPAHGPPRRRADAAPVTRKRAATSRALQASSRPR